MHDQITHRLWFRVAEPVVVTLVFFFAAIVWVAVQGGAVTWDTFNHHLYLGRQAIEGSRLNHDYFAAGGMSCQYPLGYAPLVAMLDAGLSGETIFQVLALMAAVSGPACWLAAWCVVPFAGIEALALRLTATVLALSGVLWWKLLAQTSNDAIGMSLAIWAVALALLCVDGAWWTSHQRLRWAICGLAGALAGLALVIKLTQFVGIAAALCILLFAKGRWIDRIKCLSFFCIAAISVIFWAGGSWGYEAWRACGSPIYPFMLDFFQSRVPGVTP